MKMQQLFVLTGSAAGSKTSRSRFEREARDSEYTGAAAGAPHTTALREMTMALQKAYFPFFENSPIKKSSTRKAAFTKAVTTSLFVLVTAVNWNEFDLTWF